MLFKWLRVRNRKISESSCTIKYKQILDCEVFIYCFYCIGKILYQSDSQEATELPLFSFSTIADATASFSSDNKIGEGGFGSVYKVLLECKFHRVTIRS